MTYINLVTCWGHFFSQGTPVWPWPVVIENNGGRTKHKETTRRPTTTPPFR